MSFEVQVKGATTKAEAKTLAKSIVTSSLTKAAIFGHDANWGRILCAMGYSGADFDPERLTYSLRVKQVSFRLLKMELLQITARRKQRKYFHRIL